MLVHGQADPGDGRAHDAGPCAGAGVGGEGAAHDTSAVKTIYDTKCRNHCADADGNHGPSGRSPITRHLLHSYQSVFNRYTESILQHLVVKQASRVVDADGHVADDERKALLNTIDHLVKWRAEGRRKRRRIATVKDN